ncbi:hypothetical protein [Pseudoalteromonas sp. SWYJZ19]|uniref:hypothetical protein n=1 Tax=Pseudoalteromonas sp. SWYJZ19 TaxID=2792068 RepID=UPI0018CCBCAA|nr:hypothetical protein [Pseudoalteromonas sp. SWYJZ19]MBH0051935.1 hypothetical protein [Pseudoalteromonas sp. SWYJZ19]
MKKLLRMSSIFVTILIAPITGCFDKNTLHEKLVANNEKIILPPIFDRNITNELNCERADEHQVDFIYKLVSKYGLEVIRSVSTNPKTIEALKLVEKEIELDNINDLILDLEEENQHHILMIEKLKKLKFELKKVKPIEIIRAKVYAIESMQNASEAPGFIAQILTPTDWYDYQKYSNHLIKENKIECKVSLRYCLDNQDLQSLMYEKIIMLGRQVFIESSSINIGSNNPKFINSSNFSTLVNTPFDYYNMDSYTLPYNTNTTDLYEGREIEVEAQIRKLKNRENARDMNILKLTNKIELNNKKIIKYESSLIR